MSRIGLKSSGAKRDRNNGTMPCKICKTKVHNVDSEAAAVICFKCVSRSINPHTIFVDELSQEEWDNLRKKL
jgi:hypothetical protein